MDPYEGGCLLPWPSSRFQTQTDAGHVIALPREGMPSNAMGPVDPEPWNGRDGYSPMTSMIVRIDRANELGPLASWRAPETDTTGTTILLDTTDDPHGVPVAHFAETQSSTVDIRFLSDGVGVDDPVEPCWTTLYIRPAARLTPNHHYVVGVRAVGAPPISPPGFDAMRTRPTSPPALAARAADLEANVLSVLDPVVPREELIVAWDFWTGSDEDASADLSAMRDVAMAMIDGLGCEASSTTDADGNVTVTGTIDVPYFLNDTTVIDGTSIDALETNGSSRLRRPIGSTNTLRAPFEAYIPRTARDRSDAIPVVEYGHGLLNWSDEVAGDEITPVWRQSAMIGVSTVAHGLAGSPLVGETRAPANDQLRILNALRGLSAFSSLTDHILQGVVAQLVLPHVFVRACVPQIPVLVGHSVDSTRFAWLGNSQGGIMGPTIGALDPSFDRLALGVGGASYSIMLPRSCDWPEQWLADLLRTDYPHSRFQRDLLMTMFQTHFDRFEGATFAAGIADRHVLYQTAVGDLGTPEVSGEIAARTMGLGRLAESATAPFGIDPVPTTDPITRAFVSYSFEGAPTPPDGPEWNIDQCVASDMECRPHVHDNVHEWVRRDDASRQQIQHFLTTGEVRGFCDGGSCANRPACPPN
jgi:hypothetical protein